MNTGFPTGLGKTVLKSEQIKNLDWIENKQEFLEKQRKIIANLETRVESYKLFIESDPSRSHIEKRIEMLENMRELYSDLMLEPPQELMYEMPLIDLELEKLRNEQIVIEFLDELKSSDGLLGEKLRKLFEDSPLRFVVDLEQSADELHSDFVRGFALTMMNEGKQVHTYFEIFKEDPERASQMLEDSFEILFQQDWSELWPMLQEVAGVVSEDMWKKIYESDGAYASFLAGKVTAFIMISVLTGSLSGLNKMGKFVKFAGMAGIAGKRLEMKYIASLSDGYDFLTNPEIHEKLLRMLHKKLPELGIVNLRGGLEAMIRYIIVLPPGDQSEAVSVLLDFVAQNDLSILQKSEHFKKWISMWIQREEDNEQIGVGTKLWDDRYENEVEEVAPSVDDQKMDEIMQEYFWGLYGIPEFKEEKAQNNLDEFKGEFLKVLQGEKEEIRKFSYENRELVRKLILEETPFGWRVSFRNLMTGIVTKLQTHVGLGDIFGDDELEVPFSVTYPRGYHGKDALVATERKGRKYLNKDGKYLAIFDDCDIIIR